MGGVALALIGEVGRFLTEIGIDYAFKSSLPRGGEFLAGLGVDTLEVALHAGLHLIVVMLLLSILQAGVSLLGHDAIFAPHIEHIVQAATLGKVHVAIVADESIGLVEIAVAHGVHLREVKLGATFAQNFIFHK